MADFIQIVIKNDDIETWKNYDDVSHILAKGEPAAVWEVKTNPSGQVLYEADGVTPQTGKLLYHVIGDGASTFSQLVPLWPVAKGTFNSLISNRAGTGRDLDDITKANATHRYNTLGEALDAFFHPYALPSFAAFNPSSFEMVEVGLSHDPNISFAWSSNNAQNVKAGSVMIRETFNGTNNTVVSGQNASGTYAATGLTARRGMSIGQEVSYTISGQNTKNAAMQPLTRTRTWGGKRVFFMHPDSEWLINGMTAKMGDPVDVANTTDAQVAAYINAHLDSAGQLGNGLWGTTQNGKTNVVDMDGGTEGKRAYFAIPKTYRSSVLFIDPSFSVQIAPTLTREVDVVRNGVTVRYVLIGLDLRIVQILKAQLQ